MATRAIRIGDAVLQLTDAVALKASGDDATWFITAGIEVRADMKIEDALKLMGWTVSKTVKEV
jgi:hypothetical protein